MIQRGMMLGNRYEILEKVGEGGSAIVYKAKDHILNRFVAVKVLKDELALNEEFVEKFKKEAYSAASLSNNNIVNIYDVGSEENINYIVQEYIDGKTLKEIIRENGSIPWEKAIGITRQIASAIDCAHKNNIIHRDIKPHNIIVTKDGIAKVADFGIAKATDSATITNTNQVMGSAHYLSPEQAKGTYIDGRTDIYSLGIVMYEMLTGKVPFDGESPVAIALKHIRDEIVPPIDINPDIPVSLNNLVLKAVEKEPIKRFQTAQELIDELDNLDESDVKKFVPNSLDDDFTRVMDPVDSTTLFDSPYNEAEDENKNDNLDDDLKNEDAKDEEKAEDADKNKPKAASKLSKKKKTIITAVLAVLAIVAIVALGYSLGSKGGSSSKTSSGTVPNIIGMNQAAAKKLIEGDGYQFVIVKTQKSSKAKGTVLQCYPSVGSSINKGDEVRVYVSAGNDDSSVPSVSGMDAASAEQTIQASGYTVGNISYSSSDSVAKGLVISQNPDAGSKAAKNSTINIVVSTGPAVKKSTVPSVTNTSKEAAIAAISAVGLNPSVSFVNTTNSSLNGTVASQDPAPGSSINRGSTVSITVYQYTQPQTTGNTNQAQQNTSSSGGSGTKGNAGSTGSGTSTGTGSGSSSGSGSGSGSGSSSGSGSGSGSGSSSGSGSGSSNVTGNATSK